MINGIFHKLLFPFLRVAYAGIAVCGTKAFITTRIYQNRRMIKEEKREFEMPKSVPSQMMFDYLLKLQRHNSYTYTATALSSINQGAIPSCEEAFFHKMHVDTNNILTVCKDDQWSIYASAFDIEEIEKAFAPLEGIDYIFPTESLIDYLHETMNIEVSSDGATAFLLYDKTSATLAVYQNENLTYSSHFIFDEEEEEIVEDNSNGIFDLLDDSAEDAELGSDIVQLDDVSDDFGSLEDLNNFIGSDDPMSLENAHALALDDVDPAPKLTLGDDQPQTNMRRDMLLFNFIKNSFNDFYKNENYESSFIDQAIIFDTHNGAKSIGQYMSRELCIETAVFDIEMSETICNLALKEADL